MDVAPQPKTRWRFARWITSALCVTYATAAVGFWIVLNTLGDRWWPATVLLYGPRYLWLAPLALLLPLTAIVRWRQLWLPIATGLLVAGPVMGFYPRWHAVLPGHASVGATRLRILTCNIDQDDLNGEALGRLVVSAKPDVVVLQAWMPHYRSVVFPESGWHFSGNGELFVASRVPIQAVTDLNLYAQVHGSGAAAQYDVNIDGKTVSIFNVHFATPRSALMAAIKKEPDTAADVMENMDVRRRQFEILSRATAAVGGPVVLAGDLNTLPESTLHRYFTKSMRNAYSTVGGGWGFTHFTRRTAIRIDHVYADRSAVIESCWVGPNVGSAHRPVIAQIAWPK